MTITRRTFVERALRGAAFSLAFVEGTTTVLLTPKEARARQLPYRHLDAEQSGAIELLSEGILPGAVDQGIIHFIDHQLGVDPDDSLLTAKYFQVEPPFKNFYVAGAKAAAEIAALHKRRPLKDLASKELHDVIAQMAIPGAAVAGFPVFTFYLCLRSDAMDVVYGTPQGFKRLNLPYMEHILPPRNWNDGTT